MCKNSSVLADDGFPLIEHITVMCSYCLEYILIFSNFLIYVLQ